MARCRLTLEQYRRLLEAFREEPGNAARAARIAEVDPRTALRAWHRGWIAPPWARCIEQVVDEARLKAHVVADKLEGPADLVGESGIVGASTRAAPTIPLSLVSSARE